MTWERAHPSTCTLTLYLPEVMKEKLLPKISIHYPANRSWVYSNLSDRSCCLDLTPNSHDKFCYKEMCSSKRGEFSSNKFQGVKGYWTAEVRNMIQKSHYACALATKIKSNIVFLCAWRQIQLIKRFSRWNWSLLLNPNVLLIHSYCYVFVSFKGVLTFVLLQLVRWLILWQTECGMHPFQSLTQRSSKLWKTWHPWQ